MNSMSRKENVLRLIQAHPAVTQQELADQLQLSRSAVAGYVAALMREGKILGRAYVLPDHRPVVCIGGANLDRKLRTLNDVQMATSNPVSQFESFGGVARNVAENLARCGQRVQLLSIVGDDTAGQAILSYSAEQGIDVSACLTLAGFSSGSYTAVLNPQGEMVLALSQMDVCERLDPHFLRSRQRQRNAAAMVIADLNLPADSLSLLLQDAQQQHIPLVLIAVSQPKMQRLPAQLQGLRLLILNHGELEQRAGQALPDQAAIQQAVAKLRTQGVQDVIVTMGSAGVLCTRPDTNLLTAIPAPQCEVVDVTGAGDAFSAGVCYSLLQQATQLELACQRGQQLAALTLQSGRTVSGQLHPNIFQEDSYA
ncbi:winged helix-turn-helix transcriptional regulator [Undibacterium sp. CY7W]|uniref:Winged helix-turn-helix transcriptional regulator n=2 Tax=Undibacterium rugosum TaxID=2762291 RepID=A0A923HZ71_9BURK|nr:winged helix-turn-helix transcriptional regulator [Undibacterium rugosum]